MGDIIVHKVLGFTPRFDCTSSYRLINPCNLFSGTNIKIIYTDTITTQALSECDAVIIHRASLGGEILVLARTIKQLGKKIIFDLDDMLWELPWGWCQKEIDEEGISHYRLEEERIKTVAKLLEYVDAITCSTDELRNSIMNRFSCNDSMVTVLNNFSQISGNIKPIETPNKDKILVQGDHRHAFYDWYPLRDLDIEDKTLAVFGLPEDIFLSYGWRMKSEYWAPVWLNMFYSVMRTIGAGVGLAPLQPEFMLNKCKSIIKVLEYARMGMSAVVSPVGEYTLCPHLYFANFTPDSWREQILRAIDTPNINELQDWCKHWNATAMEKWRSFYGNLFGVKVTLIGEPITARVANKIGGMNEKTSN